jgi:hypothetical protein
MAGNGAVHYRDGIDALLESVAGPAAKTGPRYLRLNGFEDKEVCPERHRKKTADGGAAGNLDQARIREIVLEIVERVTGSGPTLQPSRNGLSVGSGLRKAAWPRAQ